MQTKTLGAALALALSAAVVAGAQETAPAQPRKIGPRMQVVFVLDTTGSMGGLIATAKQKIWAISNEILRGKPTPRLSIGLVAYRDRGDQYVTRTYPLTADLDQVHKNLMSFRAGGGGDTREHVNKALHDAVHSMAWTEEKGAVKIIFLVGDAPPHMDYNDGLDYRVSASEAIRKGIMINTLRIGHIGGTEEVWREIARKADGSYKHIKVKAALRPEGVVTKHDVRLRALYAKLGRGGASSPRTTLAYTRALKAPGAPAAEGAWDSRGRSGGRADLISDLINGKVKLESVPEARLPADLKKLPPAKRLEALRKRMEERRTVLAEVKKLEAARSKIVAGKMKKRAMDAGIDKSDDAFDRAVVESVKKAAEKAGVRYDEKKKKEAPEKKDGDR